MRHALWAVAATLVPVLTWAAPMTMTHQGRLADAAGAALNGEYDIRIRLYNTAEVVLFEDTFESVPVASGYFSVVLGSGAPLERDDLMAEPVLLGIKVDENDEMPTRQQLHSAPYAINAGGVTLGNVTTCNSDAAGTLRWVGDLQVCDGEVWQSVQTGRNGTAASPGASCDQIHDDFPLLPSGVFFVDPQGTGPVQAYCEMSLAGGGWTRIVTVDASIGLCNLTNARGTKQNVADGAGTAWWSAADVDAMGFSQVMLWISDSNYMRFTSPNPEWTWANVADGTYNSFSNAGVSAARNEDPSFSALNAQGCNRPGCMLSGGYNNTSDWTPILGIGANNTGVFVQNSACSAVPGNRGMYQGHLGGAWNASGYVYVR